MINQIKFWLFRRRYKVWSSEIKMRTVNRAATASMKPGRVIHVSKEEMETRMKMQQMLMGQLQSEEGRRRQQVVGVSNLFGAMGGSLGVFLGNRLQKRRRGDFYG